jgi:hypothetical protein
MLTRERLEEVGELIDLWNEKEKGKEEYQTNDDALGYFEVLDASDDGLSRCLVDHAASEMGVTIA